MKPTPFPKLLHAFFHDWLVQQRNVSHHTVLSYRDSWRLFLRFIATQKTTSVAKLGLSDLTAVDVLAFLQHLEQERQSSIGTRNCRLGALHSFFSFVADREPLAAAQCAAVLRIPTKQAPTPEVPDLDEEEISASLAQPDQSRIEGQRDHVLLAILYNTGARIQEALNLSRQALRLESPFHVRLLGKGRKERIRSALAGDGHTAEGSVKETASRGQRTDLSQPIRPSPFSGGRSLQVEELRGGGGQTGSIIGQQTRLPTYVSPRRRHQSCHGRR